MKSLLMDIFGIDGSDRNKLDPIRSRYLSFKSRMENTTFSITKQPNKKGELQFKAYVDSTKANEINVVDPDYFKEAKKHRSITLIHEYIHLLFPHEDHPGGTHVAFGRTTLGIPYDKEIKNAYCYQYFAEWLK